jgi:hypothetical protein
MSTKKLKCSLNSEDVDPIVATQCAIKLLEAPFWPEGLNVKEVYSRVHDDCDGKTDQKLFIEFLEVGDVLISTYAHKEPGLRFRMPMFGGGRSPKTRNALLFLALAMKLDNEEKPDD